MITVPVSVQEGSGVLLDAGTVSTNHTLDSDLIVDLSPSNPSEVTVPSTVTIPSGTTSVPFDITVFDDALLDGLKIVSINASAVGYQSDTSTIQIEDDETAILAVWTAPHNPVDHQPALVG